MASITLFYRSRSLDESWVGDLAAGVRHQLVEEARLALVEALRVEGIGEPEVPVVEVVTELVEESPEVGPERHDPPLPRRAHPELDAGQTAVLDVEALELPPATVRAGGQHLHATGPDAERAGESGEEGLGRHLDGEAVLGEEGRVERGHVRVMFDGVWKTQTRDRVAVPVDALLGPTEAFVVGEAARRGLRRHDHGEGRSFRQDGESLGPGGCAQPIVQADESGTLRRLVAPGEGRGELQRIRGTERMSSQEAPCAFP